MNLHLWNTQKVSPSHRSFLHFAHALSMEHRKRVALCHAGSELNRTKEQSLQCAVCSAVHCVHPLPFANWIEMLTTTKDVPLHHALGPGPKAPLKSSLIILACKAKLLTTCSENVNSLKARVFSSVFGQQYDGTWGSLPPKGSLTLVHNMPPCLELVTMEHMTIVQHSGPRMPEHSCSVAVVGRGHCIGRPRARETSPGLNRHQMTNSYLTILSHSRS